MYVRKMLKRTKYIKSSNQIMTFETFVGEKLWLYERGISNRYAKSISFNQPKTLYTHSSTDGGISSGIQK